LHLKEGNFMSQLARSIIRLTLLSTPVVFLGSPVFLSALPAQAQQTAVAQERMAIAVVNFKPLKTSGYDYLREALPEAIGAQLQKIPQIHVFTRMHVDSVLREQGFAETAFVDAKGAPRIGKLVGARYLLTGSYQVEGKKLLLYPQLIDTETGKVLFADTLQAPLTDPLEVQRDAAQQVASRLAINLNPKTREALKKVAIQNEQALKAYVEGLHLLDQEKLQPALAAFSKSIEHAPDFVEAHQQLMAVAKRMGQVSELLPRYQQWIPKATLAPILWNYLGNVYLERGEWSQAEQAYLSCIKGAPDFLPAYNNLGVLAMVSKQDHAKGLEWFRKALQINPLEPATYYNIGKLYYEQKDHEQGQHHFRQALSLSHGLYLKEIQQDLFGGALKIGGQSRQLPGGQVVGEVRLKRQDQPEIVLMEIHDDLGGFSKVDRAHIVSLRLNQMLAELTPENISEGTMNHEAVVQTKSRKLIVTVGASAAERLGMDRNDLAKLWAKSLAYYLAYEGTAYRTKSAIPTEPEEVQHLRQGDQLYGQGKYPEALAAYQKALDINWRLYSAHYSMGMIYLEQRQYPESEQSFERILKLEPGHQSALLGLAELYIRSGYPQEAKQCLDVILKQDPHHSRALALRQELK
jgi:tetratricopeptide (TPR) repeat protein